jgi:hypothetical protein
MISTKMAVLWDAVPCSLVDTAMMIKAIGSCEVSVNIYQTIWHNTPRR